MGRQVLDPRKIRCKCGYCGKDSTSGILFIPTRKTQKYATKHHYLLKQYNGIKPLKKRCLCGCNRVFYTINRWREYMKGHQTIFYCELCRLEMTRNEMQVMQINKRKWKLCQRCYDNIKKNKEE